MSLETKRKAWLENGNVDTDPTENYVGNEDAVDLRLATSATTRIRFIDSTNAIQRDDSGDARGSDAIDLQATRSASTEVASGSESVLIGGNNNTVSGNTSIGIGGNNNTVSDGASTILGGGSNNITATGTGSNVIIGGTTNTIDGTATLSSILTGTTNQVNAGAANTITGGQQNTISAGSFHLIGNAFGSTISGAQVCSILSGSGNTVTSGAQIATVVQGFQCTTDALISTVLNGSQCVINTGATASTIINGATNTVSASVFGATILNGSGSTATAGFQVLLNGTVQPSRPSEVVHSGGSFGTATSAYNGLCGMIASTTDATATNMQITPGITAATEFTIPQDHTVAVEVLVVARSTSGADHAMWRFDGLIEDTGGTLTLLSPGLAQLPIHNSGGAAAWQITPIAAGGAYRLQVVGAAATSIRWNAQLKYSEVEFA